MGVDRENEDSGINKKCFDGIGAWPDRGYYMDGVSEGLFQMKAGAVYGTFGQLLRDATAGALYHNNDFCNGFQNGEFSDFCNDENGEFQNVEQGAEGYEAGDETESENEDYDCGGDVMSSEDDDGHDYVAVVNDDIPIKKFKNRGFGPDLDDVKRGIDDTLFSEDDVEVVADEGLTVEDVDAFNHAESESAGVAGEEDSFGPGMNVANEEITPCLLGDCGCSKHEIAQEISQHYIESMKAGYKKRNRIHDGPDCRKPRDMGAIEIAVRLAGQRKTEHIFEPVLGMVFDSKEEGYEFYNMYSWESGFGIVYSKCVRRQSDPEYRSMQTLCCERSGSDPRVTGSTKKINCRARIKMLRDKDGGWYVSEFVKEHNHPFAESCSEKREWFSHKRLDPTTLEMIKQLRACNVNQTAVRCIIGSMFGGLKGAPCTKRTVRSICNQIAREQMDNDVAKTLELFREMRAKDPDFQWSVETVKDSRINTLVLWLIRNMDTQTGAISLPSGEELTVKEIDINLVLGIPHGGEPVNCGQPLGTDELNKLRTVLLMKKGGEIALRDLEKVLLSNTGSIMSEAETAAFKVALVLYLDAYFLAPKGNTVKINYELYWSIADTANVHRKNWARYVLDMLLQSAKRVKRSLDTGNRTATLDGCILFWVVFYLDNVDFGILTSQHNILPRMEAYNSDIVKRLCRLDKDTHVVGGMVNFGVKRLRRSKMVVYSRNKDSTTIISKAKTTKKAEETKCSGCQEEIEEAANAMMRWVHRVAAETEQTKALILESLHQKSGYQRNDSKGREALGGRSVGTRLRKRIGCGQSRMSKIFGEVRGSENLVELSSDSSQSTQELKEGEHSCVDSEIGDGCSTPRSENEQLALRRYSDIIAIGQETSEVCCYLTGGDPSGQAEELCYDTVGTIGMGTDEEFYQTRNTENWIDVDRAISGEGFHQDRITDRQMVKDVVDEGNGEDEGQENTNHYEGTADSSNKCLGASSESIELDDKNKVWQIVLYQAVGERNIDDFCPTPISVRKNISGEITDITITKTMVINDMEVDITHLKKITRFGMSPFVISVTHKDSELSNIFGLQKAMTELEAHDYNMVWYMHNIPSVIKIEGKIINDMIQTDNDYTIDVMDARVRMYKEMDDEIYKRWSEKRWRHFLPTDFAVAVLQGDIEIGSASVEELFKGDHVSYDVGDCRLVIATIMVHWHWCLYVWDFERMKIIILDPVSMMDDEMELTKKHSSAVSALHNGMKYCKEHYFPYPEQCMDDWEVEYVQIKGASGTRNQSGLYTMFYARYFDGEILTRILAKDSIRGQRANLMCQLLSMKNNMGEKPCCIKDALNAS